jgi:branched-chain amino acid transport system substrate-binding protein
VESLGDAGHNLSTEVWWTPTHPFKSSLTGQSTKEVADAFSEAMGRPWTQPIGFAHALFEIAVDVMKRAEDIGEGASVAKAIAETKLDTLVGPISWGSDKLPPFAQKNVAKTPLVGGQWRLKSGGGYDLVVVENGLATNVPLGGKMEALA